jgi:hypothetical protein
VQPVPAALAVVQQARVDRALLHPQKRRLVLNSPRSGRIKWPGVSAFRAPPPVREFSSRIHAGGVIATSRQSHFARHLGYRIQFSYSRRARDSN